MTTQKNICPKCITLHPDSLQTCPQCGSALQTILSTPSAAPSEASAPVAVKTAPIPDSQTATAAASEVRAECPICKASVPNDGRLNCPECHKPYPAWWLAWTKNQRVPLRVDVPFHASEQTIQTAKPPTPSRRVPAVPNHAAEIVERPYTAYNLQLMLVRGLAYLASIIAGFLFIVAAGSLNGMARNSSDIMAVLSVGLFAGSFSAFIGTFIIAFLLFLVANMLEMKIADTKNIAFMAKRANETQMLQAQLLEHMQHTTQK